MLKNLTLFAICFCAVFVVYFSSCKKDAKNNNGPTGSAVTVKDSLMLNGGVKFFGSIDPADKVSAFGFEYGQDSLFKTLTVLNISPDSLSAHFTAQIISGLNNGGKYFFRAFETVNGIEEHGAVLSFIPMDKPLTITQVIPATAAMGDTITIKGKNFDVNKTQVVFDNYASTILSISDTAIVCVVAYMQSSYDGQLTLRDNDNTRSMTQKFLLAKPVITSFTNRVPFDGIVEITGNNFDRKLNDRTEVDFGDTKAYIDYESKTLLKVTVPTIYYSSVKISVTSQFQKVTDTSAFTLPLPVFVTVPAGLHVFDRFTIAGSNFAAIPDFGYDKVIINGTQADIFAGSDKSDINTQIPDIPYPKRTATLAVSVYGQKATYGSPINILDNWVMMSNNLPFSNPVANSAFVTGGVAYNLVRALGTGSLIVEKYNPSANTWSQYQQLSQVTNYSSLATNGSKVYIYTANANNDFWLYNPATQQLTAESPFPGTARGLSTMFFIGNTVYAGFGNGYNDFYAYNTQTNTWKQVTGLPQDDFSGQTSTFFTIGGKGYVLYSSFQNELYQYDPATDTWTQKASLNTTIGYYGSFITGGEAYVCSLGYYCYQYDPVANTWTKKSMTGNGEMNNSDTRFGFTLGSKCYMGITNDSDSRYSSLYCAFSSAL